MVIRFEHSIKKCKKGIKGVERFMKFKVFWTRYLLVYNSIFAESSYPRFFCLFFSKTSIKWESLENNMFLFLILNEYATRCYFSWKQDQNRLRDDIRMLLLAKIMKLLFYAQMIRVCLLYIGAYRNMLAMNYHNHVCIAINRYKIQIM